MVSMNVLPFDKRVRILSALVEGNSMRSVSRMVGVSVNTVMKFVSDFGPVCEAYHAEHVKGLKTEHIQCDEIWAFCGMKKKHVPADQKDRTGIGDVWTWTAIEAESKLMISWHVGARNNASAIEIMCDVAGRITNDHVQITSDGYRFYKQAILEAFGDSVHYSELQKIYGAEDGGPSARYSPSVCVGCVRKRVIGNPDPAHINTSYVERANLTMRMGMRRFTRLTNGFSKKFDNHRAAVAIHFMHYNFCRVNKTLRVTPAMEAGISDHVWPLDELVNVLCAREQAVFGTDANRRGPYQKRGA